MSSWESYNTSINNFASGHSVVMSGGMISTRGNPYRFEMPTECENMSYPWESDHPDWTEYRGEAIRDIWCPELNEDGGLSWSKPYNLRCQDLTPATRRLYGCAKYKRNHAKFEIEGKDRLARTFVAKKGNIFYWGVFGKQTHRSTVKADGVRLVELSDFSQQWDYDWLINLDGGGSSTMFMNGQGTLTNSAEGIEGPLTQRMAQYALMLVPKKHTEDISAFKSNNNHYLTMDNSLLNASRYQSDYVDRPMVSFLSLTPSIKKLNNRGMQENGGIFSTSFKVDRNSDGAIIFSMSEDGYYHREWINNKDVMLKENRSMMVIGVGKIPNVLIDTLQNNHLFFAQDENNENMEKYLEILRNVNAIALYAIVINNHKISHVFVEWDRDNSNFYKKYLDGNWHHIALASIRQKRHLIIDGNPMDYEIAGNADRGDFYNLENITHIMAGAVNIDGQYVTGNRSNLSLDNMMFAIGNTASGKVIDGLKNNNHWTGTDSQILQQFISYMRDHKNLPDKYHWFAPDTYLLQMEESNVHHHHVFAVAESGGSPGQSNPGFYGLKIKNVIRNYTENNSQVSLRKTTTQEDTVLPTPSKVPDNLILYPNPTTSEVHINYQSKVKGKLEIMLLDFTGRTIFSEKKTAVKGQNHITMNLKEKGISSGTYTMKFNIGGMSESRKIVVQY